MSEYVLTVIFKDNHDNSTTSSVYNFTNINDVHLTVKSLQDDFGYLYWIKASFIKLEN